MAAEAEHMFCVRETPWHRSGTEVQEAPDSREAEDMQLPAGQHMDSPGKESEALREKKLSDKQVMGYMEILLPMEDGSMPQQEKKVKRLGEDMKLRYFDAPDLQDVGKNAYRFINAVSDFATRAQPLAKAA